MKTIYNKYMELHPIFRFGIHIVLLVIIWILFYKYFRQSYWINVLYESATQYLTDWLIEGSGIFLNLIGYDTEVQGRMIRVAGTEGILLDRGCVGRNLLGLFAGFLIAFPGRIISKLWYIPMGLLIINFINILRISALALTLKYAPEYFDINHHAIFQYVVLAATFLMWYIWIVKINKPRLKTKK